jgi:betaine-aldehyde dehydrogenase
MDKISNDVKLPKHLNQLFYGGSWHEPQGRERMDTYNPATNEVIATVAISSKEDIDAAVHSAHMAFKLWRNESARSRALKLQSVANRLREHAEEIAYLDALNAGHAFSGMLHDVFFAADRLDYFAGLATEIKGEVVPIAADRLNYITREPIGVVGLIIPFNHPAYFSLAYAAAALVTGNTIVLKPCDQAPISAVRLAELIGDLLPPGVFNVLTGNASTADALAKHPLTAKTSFVGSVAVGKKIIQSAADSLKKVMLELGGKNALIAYPDSDPKHIAEAIVNGMNFPWASGQSCSSTSRVFLHKKLHKQVIPLVVEKLRLIKHSLPTNKDCQMGCVINRQQFDRIMEFIASAKKEGATLVYGGTPPTDPALQKGNFILPTLFVDVFPNMRIAREEIFGPVISVLNWEDEANMLAEVNNVDYGLAASVWTKDLTTAHRAANQIEAGFIWINTVGQFFTGMPFGGMKHSGIGRIGWKEEALDYTQPKNIHVSLTE